MIDVDFRYVERKVKVGDFHGQIQGSAIRIEKVLQWRKKVRKQLTYHVPEPPPTAVVWPPAQFSEPEWTEWQDVRTEEE